MQYLYLLSTICKQHIKLVSQQPLVCKETLSGVRYLCLSVGLRLMLCVLEQCWLLLSSSGEHLLIARQSNKEQIKIDKDGQTTFPPDRVFKLCYCLSSCHKDNCMIFLFSLEWQLPKTQDKSVCLFINLV